MKQIIPFKKELTFKSMVSEIVSISLEHTLELTEDLIISGEFIVGGQYKESAINPNLENFNYQIPFEIAIDDKYDVRDVKIDIDDFYYELIDNNVLKVSIDVAVDGLVEKEIVDTYEEDGEEETTDKIIDYGADEDEREKGVDMMGEPIGTIVEPKITSEVIKEKVKSLFDSFDDSSETFSTYLVYIVKENDTLESILLKYNKTKEELAEYNDLEDLKIGTKLIIPATISYE
ncbi:MAG: LysM peptidoglycan-binding domain-containing protein [Bacilli bacterium]|jgi:LysM repeat protein